MKMESHQRQDQPHNGESQRAQRSDPSRRRQSSISFSMVSHSAYEYTDNVIARAFITKWSLLLRLQVESPSDHFPLKS